MSEIDILGCGIAIPRARLARKAIAEATGGGRAPAGERAVASHDEDAITLMVEAARAAAGDGLPGVELVVCATTTPPCVEKSSAALVVEACDGPPSVAALDLGGSRRAGLEALWVAAAAVRAGAATRALACAADARPIAPGDPLELRAWDAGCAFLVGRAGGGEALATIEAFGHAHAEAWDVWRREGEPTMTEDAKAVREAGFDRPIAAALAALGGGAIARLAVNAPDARAGQALAKKLGARLVEAPGDAGCATVPLALAHALVGAPAGEAIVACAAGDGARALRLRAGPRAAAFALPAGPTRAVGYAQALFLRGVLPRRGSSPEVASALLATESDAVVRLRGARCPACRAVSYPASRLCVACGAEGPRPERLARRGVVFTFTRDTLFEGAEPTTVMAVVDLDGGGRVYVQATDCTPDAIAIGTPVELVLRRIHDGGGHPNYSWKCRPVG